VILHKSIFSRRADTSKTKMVKGEPKWSANKKAQRESATSKEKAEKAKRSANKVNHRDKPSNTRALVMVRVGETEFPPKTADGEQPLPDDTEGEEELTAVG
jgi:hypothetical protein